MGLTDQVKAILKQVKKVSGIPNSVVRKLEKEFDKIHDKMDDMNAMDAIEQFMVKMMKTLDRHFRMMERKMKGQLNKMNRSMTSALDVIQSEFEKGLTHINRTMADLGDDITEKLDEAVEFAAKLKDDIFEAMGPFVRKLWSKYMPYIIVVLAILLFPMYSPMLMVLFRLVF